MLERFQIIGSLDYVDHVKNAGDILHKLKLFKKFASILFRIIMAVGKNAFKSMSSFITKLTL